MSRLLVFVVSCLLLSLAFPSTGKAGTVIASGTYAANSDTSLIGVLDRGPGKYQFRLDLTSDETVWADAVKTSYYNYYCDFGGGPVYCGGDDSPVLSHFIQVSPLTWIADLTVNPAVSIPSTGFIVRTDEFDLCCYYDGDIYSVAAGSYTLSISSLPEPAAWAVLLLGFTAIGAGLRRSQAARQDAATA